MDARDASILAQVSAKVAGDICSSSGDIDKYLSTIEAVHNDLLDRCGTAVVQATFQGTTPVVATPTPGPTPQVQTGPISADSSEEAKWQDALVSNPDNWFNNTTDKKNPAGPDFRHKNIKDGGGQFNIGLWLTSDKFKTRAPDWVFAQLGMDIPAGFKAGN